MSDGRPWQHPAERGAQSGLDYIVNPPPLGRRISMLTAIVSIIASLAVISVAVPKGISDYADEPDASTTTSIAPKVKGAAGSAMTTVTSGDTPSSALALGSGLWLAASDALGPETKVSVNSPGASSTAALVVADIGDTGTALVRTSGPAAPQMRPFDFSTIIDPDKLGDLTRYWIYDPSNDKWSRVEPSISLTSTSDDVPVSTREPIGGIASVVDDRGNVVGIVVRRGHSTWLLGRTSIELLKKSVSTK